MKDYCTMFPEFWRSIYIGDCCEKHDNTLSTSSFYECLKRRLTTVEAVLITIGGSIGAWIKYPKDMWRRL